MDLLGKLVSEGIGRTKPKRLTISLFFGDDSEAHGHQAIERITYFDGHSTMDYVIYQEDDGYALAPFISVIKEVLANGTLTLEVLNSNNKESFFSFTNPVLYAEGTWVALVGQYSDQYEVVGSIALDLDPSYDGTDNEAAIYASYIYV